MKAIIILKLLKEKMRDLYMGFSIQRKPRIPSEAMWWILKKKPMPSPYIDSDKNMYDGPLTNTETKRDQNYLLSLTDVHQGSTTSS